MTSQVEKIELFAALHKPGDPLILFNIWDAGSALAVAKAGAKALATGSLSVAGAQGFGDGEKMPLDLVVANVARIANATSLSVTLDFEGGYIDDLDNFASALRSVFEAGVVGINIEDQRIGDEGLRSISEQSARIMIAAKAGLFVNARTDLFIKAPVDAHDAALVGDALERAAAYADAGARSFFVPMLTNADLLDDLCSRSPLPVNVMMKAGLPNHAALARLGVARISYGPAPWRGAMTWLEDQASATFARP
jgi:2-methylisocitrate lyase-like PEP mutase family enzyme